MKSASSTSDCPVCRDYPQTNNFPAGIVNPISLFISQYLKHRVLKLTHDHKKYELFRRLMHTGNQKKANQLQNRTPAVSYRLISKDESEVINSLIIRRAQTLGVFAYRDALGPQTFSRRMCELENESGV